MEKVFALLQSKGRTAEENHSFFEKAVEIAEAAGIDRGVVERAVEAETLEEVSLKPTEEQRPGPACMTTYDTGRAPRARVKKERVGITEEK